MKNENETVSYLHGKCPHCKGETNLESVGLLECIEEVLMKCPRCHKTYVVKIYRDITYRSMKLEDS